MLSPVDALNAVDGVMTAATLGVAVSGSIVLQHGPAEGRRVLTLLPDYHLCVIEASQVVETLPEAFTASMLRVRLRSSPGHRPRRISR